MRYRVIETNATPIIRYTCHSNGELVDNPDKSLDIGVAHQSIAYGPATLNKLADRASVDLGYE